MIYVGAVAAVCLRNALLKRINVYKRVAIRKTSETFRNNLKCDSNEDETDIRRRHGARSWGELGTEKHVPRSCIRLLESCFFGVFTKAGKSSRLPLRFRVTSHFCYAQHCKHNYPEFHICMKTELNQHEYVLHNYMRTENVCMGFKRAVKMCFHFNDIKYRSSKKNLIKKTLVLRALVSLSVKILPSKNFSVHGQ